MNRKSRIAFGPGAASLILIVVLLSMSILGILSLMSARSDLSFSKRSVEVIQAVYALQNQAEESYARLDDLLQKCAAKSESESEYLENIRQALSSDWSLEGDMVEWEETDGTRTIYCSVTVAPFGTTPRLAWTMHTLYTEIDGGFW